MRSVALVLVGLAVCLQSACGDPGPTSLERAQARAAEVDAERAVARAEEAAAQADAEAAAVDVAAARLGLSTDAVRGGWTVAATPNALAVGLADPATRLCVLVAHTAAGLAVVGMGSPPPVPPALRAPGATAGSATHGDMVAAGDDLAALEGWVQQHCRPGGAG